MEKENKPQQEPKDQEHQEFLKKSDVNKKTKHQEFMQEHERLMNMMNDHIKKYAEGGEVDKDKVENLDKDQPETTQPAPGQPPVNININAGQPGAAAPAAPQIQEQPQQSPPPTPSVLAQPGPQAQQPLSSDPEGDAIEKEFSNEPPENIKESLNAPSPMQSAQQMYAQARAEDKQDSINEYNNFAQDLTNGHITPKTYKDLFAKKDTLGKIGTYFGLLLGGAGAGITHTENPVIAMMDKQIDNDLKAQQHSKDNAMNFWKVNQADLANKTGSMLNSANATLATYAGAKIRAYQVTAHHLAQLAENAPPSQQAKYAQTLQGLKAVMDKEVANLIDLRATAAAAQGINPGAFKNGSQPSTPAQGKENGTSQKTTGHILNPGADQRLQGLVSSGISGPLLDSVREQKAKADLADKALDTIDEQFEKMDKNAGVGAYARSQSHNFDKLPLGIGHAVSGAVDFATDTPKNRGFDTAYSQVVGAVRGALQGNVSEDLLDDLVKKNAPKYDDTPELKREKKKAFKDFIASHTRTDLLRTYGMSKK